MKRLADATMMIIGLARHVHPSPRAEGIAFGTIEGEDGTPRA
jgi:hypothetical protein